MSNQQRDNTNRLAAWKNTDKQNDKSADYSGTLNVEGDEFFVDIWINTIQSGEKAGQKMLSGKVKAKQQRSGGNQGGGQQRGGYQQGGNRRNQGPDDF
jgi:hypothetical protein